MNVVSQPVIEIEDNRSVFQMAIPLIAIAATIAHNEWLATGYKPNQFYSIPDKE